MVDGYKFLIVGLGSYRKAMRESQNDLCGTGSEFEMSGRTHVLT